LIGALSLSALLAGLGTLAALQVLFVFYRRSFGRLLEHLRFQSFALLVAAVVAERAGKVPGTDSFWGWIHLLALLVSVDLAYRLLDFFVIGRQRDARGRLAVPKLVRDLGAWILLALTTIFASHAIFGTEYKDIVLPTTVVSAVLGFALQDVLKNIFAGLALQTEAPFDTGDWLVVDGEPRQVLEMTWRTTKMRNNLGIEFAEPNANLANARIENLGSGVVPMGFEVEVSVAYGAPPRQVKDALERAAKSSKAVAVTPEPVGLLTAFGDSGVVYRLRFWSTHVFGVARLLDEVRSRVWYELKRSGFVIPFPIRTVEHKRADKIAADLRAELAGRAAELFSRIDFLVALPPEVRQQLAAVAAHHHYDRGETLVLEGQHGDSLIVLARGSVSVTKSGAEIGASTVSLALLQAGAYLGEMSLLTGAPRSATVTAQEAVETFEIDRAALTPILRSDPRLAEILSRVLAERVAATVARFEDRRDELSRHVAVEESSILSKIRHLFRLD